MDQQPLPLAVLISGGGTTLLNLLDCIDAGLLNATVTRVIASRAQAKGVERARNRGLDVLAIDKNQPDDTHQYSEKIFHAVREANAQIVVMAGWLNLLHIPEDYNHRVLNIHPALLPAFGGKGMYGSRVHEAVIAHGAKISGCTVHFADAAYDNGPIIVQRTCPVWEDDDPQSLAQRVFAAECRAYPHALNLIAQGRVLVDGRRTRIAPPRYAHDPHAIVRHAREYAAFAHAGQERAGGGPYAAHPQAVAQSLLDAGIDITDANAADTGDSGAVLIAAAHLHDVIEDSPAEKWHIQRAFGPRIAELVDQLSIPHQPGRTGPQKAQILVDMAKQMQPAARAVKLADRLHNLQAMRVWPRDRQQRYARATHQLLDALKPWPIPQLAHDIQNHIAQFD